MNIVILGGGGFIGSAIVERLLKDGHSIRIFEREGIHPYRTYEKNEKIEWITGDWQSRYDVSLAIEKMDCVIHLISTTIPKSSNDDSIYDVQTNIIPSLQLLGIMVEKNVKKIIFISSGGTVYGVPEYTPIDERHQTNPMVSYGIDKLTIEKYLLMYEKLYGIKAIILRVSNPYGERQNPEKSQGVIGVFMAKALKKQPIDIWGAGDIIRDYIYITDVAEAFALAINYSGEKNIFNIGSGFGFSLNDLISKIEAVTTIKIFRNYLPSRSFDVPKNILDIELAKKELKWSPRVKLEEGLKITFEWLKKIIKF